MVPGGQGVGQQAECDISSRDFSLSVSDEISGLVTQFLQGPMGSKVGLQGPKGLRGRGKGRVQIHKMEI